MGVLTETKQGEFSETFDKGLRDIVNNHKSSRTFVRNSGKTSVSNQGVVFSQFVLRQLGCGVGISFGS